MDKIKKSSRECKFDNCDIIPSFGKSGTKIKEYCAEHKPIDYVNIISKKCKFNNCDIQPSFGKPGTKIKEYCGEHHFIKKINKIILNKIIYIAFKMIFFIFVDLKIKREWI